MRFTREQYLAHEARLKSKNEPSGEGCADESKLHQQIAADCKQRGWIALHGSMAHKAMRTIGEQDFTILAEGGKVYLVECKTKSGKLSPEQMGLKMWAEKLGHTIYTIRSMKQWLEIVYDTAMKPTRDRRDEAAKGVCIVCGSALVLALWRGHPDNLKVHCNDCGSEVTAWMHAKKQPNEKRAAHP